MVVSATVSALALAIASSTSMLVTEDRQRADTRHVERAATDAAGQADAHSPSSRNPSARSRDWTRLRTAAALPTATTALTHCPRLRYQPQHPAAGRAAQHQEDQTEREGQRQVTARVLRPEDHQRDGDDADGRQRRREHSPVLLDAGADDPRERLR